LISSPGPAHAVETPLHPLLDSSGTLRPRHFLADHAAVNPLGAPQRTLLERTLVHQANDQAQTSADILRLHQLKQRVQGDISAVQTSLRLLQSQHAYLDSQIYQLMLLVPPAGLNQQPSMFNSNPVATPRWPNVSAYATARPALPLSTDEQLNSHTKTVDSIPTDAAGQEPIQQSTHDNEESVSSESSVDNDDAPEVATSSSPPPLTNLTKKRRREGSASDRSDSDNRDIKVPENGSKSEPRFSSYQEGVWEKLFNELRSYRDRTGNCFVPQDYMPNQPLARWVKRKRYQYKLMIDGRPSLMTKERAKALEEIGFVWSLHHSTWSERLEELKEFRGIFTHCNVPSNYHENPLLANWVRSQRCQYKLYQEGKSSQMTAQRIRDLEENGFEWVLRLRQKKTSS
jgi:hypothetical protein